MRVAAIDLGSNSFHLLIVEVRGPRSFEIVAQDKMMIQVGRTALVTGRLDGETIDRALVCLAEFRRIALSRRVERVLAVATSAIREAENGDEFLQRARAEIGLPVRTITGREEARLIHLAVTRHVPLASDRALLIDIGGGSAELTVGDSERIHYSTSLRLGFLRLQGQFVASDPMTADEAGRTREHLRQELARVQGAIRKARPARAVATSGSATTLLRLVLRRRSRRAGRSTPEEVSRSEIGALLEGLNAIPLAERVREFDLDPMRAGYLPMALLTLDTILEVAGIDRCLVSPVALREGLIYDFIGRSKVWVPAPSSDPRDEAVLDLARRCDYPAEHSHRVAALAEQIFDACAPLHEMADEERRLLRYAALLHDIGYHIGYTRHHKHGYYLVTNCDLRGVTPREREVIAAVVRYHRRTLPRKSHDEFARLQPADRRIVRRLVSVLRIADALDRSHFSVVERVTCRLSPGCARFQIAVGSTYPGVGVDLDHVRRHAEYFERLFSVLATFSVRRLRSRAAGGDGVASRRGAQ